MERGDIRETASAFLCGGAVCNGVSGSGAGGGSSPAPVVNSTPLLPKAVERNDVQSGIAVFGGLMLFAEFTNFPGGSYWIDGSCSHSSTQTTADTGPVSYTVVATQYYDTACTQPHIVVNGNVLDDRSGSLSATKTIYSRGGATTRYDTVEVTASFISSPIEVAITAASAAGGQPTTHQDLVCTRGQTSVCNVASTTGLADGSMLGASFVLTIDAAASRSAEVLNLTSPVSEYASSAGGLTIAQAAAATLTIAGSPLLVSTSLAGFVETVSSDPTDYLTNTDATFGDTVTIRESSVDGITIGIAAGFVPLGSGKLDADGNGTITYSDGSQSVVAGLNLMT